MADELEERLARIEAKLDAQAAEPEPEPFGIERLRRYHRERGDVVRDRRRNREEADRDAE